MPAETAAKKEYIPYYAEKSKYPGILGWIFSTDHKRIGILYLFSIIIFFLSAVVLGIVMRIHMMPGVKFLTPQQYNAVFTLHGIIQIFLVSGDIPRTPCRFSRPMQIW